MDRRGFLKTLMASAVMGAAISTGLGRTEAIKLVTTAAPESSSVGQVWAVNNLGGYLYSNQLSEELRKQLAPAVKFRHFKGMAT